MTIHYYLAYGEFKGPGSVGTLEGTFEIADFSFGGAVAVDLKAPGGPGQPPPDFSEVTLSLSGQTAIPNFFIEAAAGKGMGVSIIGIDDQANTVMEIKLDGVLISGLFDNTEGFSLSLNYTKIKIDTTLNPLAGTRRVHLLWVSVEIYDDGARNLNMPPFSLSKRAAPAFDHGPTAALSGDKAVSDVLRDLR